MIRFGKIALLILIACPLTAKARGDRGRDRGRSRDEASSVEICFVNPFMPSKFLTREVNEVVKDFFVQLGNREGKCNEHCSSLCDDKDACTVDDNGSCEEDGCPAFPRKIVDCSTGFVCDSNLGCIASVPENESDTPTIAKPSPQPSTRPPLESTTPHPTPTPFACTQNPLVYGLSVDIQVDFEDDKLVACSEEEWSQIQTLIIETLNSTFPSVAPDWNGDVRFEPVIFDADQQVTNVRRLLRGSEQGHRDLSYCSTDRNIPCEQDICHWGCLIVSTTSCGVNSLTNWFGLGRELRGSLSGLDYECLGSPNGLVVNILVDDPTDVA